MSVLTVLCNVLLSSYFLVFPIISWIFLHEVYQLMMSCFVIVSYYRWTHPRNQRFPLADYIPRFLLASNRMQSVSLTGISQLIYFRNKYFTLYRVQIVTSFTLYFRLYTIIDVTLGCCHWMFCRFCYGSCLRTSNVRKDVTSPRRRLIGYHHLSTTPGRTPQITKSKKFWST